MPGKWGCGDKHGWAFEIDTFEFKMMKLFSNSQTTPTKPNRNVNQIP